jgi:hypothetical protein
MLFGKKKKKREGALDEDSLREMIKVFQVNDGVTIERINWDGSRSTISGRITHVHPSGGGFGMVEEGSGEAVDYSIDSGDLAGLNRMAISIDLDETQTESYMGVESIVELLEALDHGDRVQVAYYDELKGRGVSKTGVITLKDEYNKLFAIEFDEDGEKKELNFDLTKDRIIDIIIE